MLVNIGKCCMKMQVLQTEILTRCRRYEYFKRVKAHGKNFLFTMHWKAEFQNHCPDRGHQKLEWSTNTKSLLISTECSFMRLIFHLYVIFQVRYVLKMSQPVGLDYFSATVHYSTSLRIWAVSGYRPHAVSSLWGCSHQDGTTSGDRSQWGPSLTMAVTAKAPSLLIFCHFSWCWCLKYVCIMFSNGKDKSGKRRHGWPFFALQSQSVNLQVFHYSTDLKGALLWLFPDLINWFWWFYLLLAVILRHLAHIKIKVCRGITMIISSTPFFSDILQTYIVLVDYLRSCWLSMVSILTSDLWHQPGAQLLLNGYFLFLWPLSLNSYAVKSQYFYY